MGSDAVMRVSNPYVGILTYFVTPTFAVPIYVMQTFGVLVATASSCAAPTCAVQT